MDLNKKFLQKVADFVKIAVNEAGHLSDKTAELEAEVLQYRKKEAAEAIARDRLDVALKKAADALYDADFITDDIERRNFLKKAREDVSYLARTLEKVCNAADVALIGKPARVANKQQKEAEYDPVMAKAFGFSANASIIDES